MERQISKTYQTEDGHVFISLQGAERHDDELQLLRRIMDEVGHINNNDDMISLTKWLINNYDMTPKNQLPALAGEGGALRVL